VFPRSGQQVFVLVPHHLAELVARRFDHKIHPTDPTSRSVPNSNSAERTSHTQ
jgi:hypothetical protein